MASGLSVGQGKEAGRMPALLGDSGWCGLRMSGYAIEPLTRPTFLARVDGWRTSAFAGCRSAFRPTTVIRSA